MWWKAQRGEIKCAWDRTSWHYSRNEGQTLTLTKMKEFEHSNVEGILFLKESIKAALIPLIVEKTQRSQWKTQFSSSHNNLEVWGNRTVCSRARVPRGSISKALIYKNPCPATDRSPTLFLFINSLWLTGPFSWVTSRAGAGRKAKQESVYSAPSQFRI